MRCINYLSEYLVPVVLFISLGLRCFRNARFLDDLSKGRLRGLKIGGWNPADAGGTDGGGRRASDLRFCSISSPGVAGGTGGISAYTGTGGSAASGASGVQFGGDGAALR